MSRQQPPLSPPQKEEAIFAGGCFWCMVSPFEQQPGVLEVWSGYTGGHVANPTYEQVCSGRTGHVEAVRIVYDPQMISYEQLLDIFWRHIDPTDAEGQFADRGTMYQTAIFVQNQSQKIVAEASKQALAQSRTFSAPIVTPIIEAQPFYVAESYHQQYYRKHPQRYNAYRIGSGRATFLRDIWGS